MVIGAGAVQAWVRASVPSVDLQVTVTEVRPDGKETFVQGGWLRTSLRKLDARKSTLLEPVLSLRRADAAPLPRGRFTKVTIPLYYEGHAYRRGSRIRIIISAPNGDQPIWAFAQLHPQRPGQGVAGPVAHDAGAARAPGRLGGLGADGLPPCPGLRGEPCRSYVPLR